MNSKLLVGIALGFGIGFGCRAAGIPVPAPPVLVGALLVLAMTTGYLLADRFATRSDADRASNDGGPAEASMEHKDR